MVDGDKSHLLQSAHLTAIVDNIAQRVEHTTLSQRLLGPADSVHHSEAKARFLVYDYSFNHLLIN